MSKVEYTSSELWNKHALEHLFWIEIAKRKAAMAEPEAFAELLSLRNEVATYVERRQLLSTEPLEIDAGTVFDIVQFEWEVDEHAASKEEVRVLTDTLALFGHRVEGVNRVLTYCRGFRLTDFSVETDLMQLDWWWGYINSSRGRKELGAVGRFSSIGEPRLISQAEGLCFDGDEAPTIELGEMVESTSMLAIPVSIPIPVTSRKLWTYDTDNHEITVSGRPLQDKVVLAFEIEKPLPSLREIERLLHAAHGMAKVQRFFSYLEQGIARPDLLSGDDDNEDIETRLKKYVPTQPEDHRLFEDVNNFRPTVLGLSCWDRIRLGMTIESACVETANAFKTTEDRVAYGLKKVRSAIKSYKTSLLPWND